MDYKKPLYPRPEDKALRRKIRLGMTAAVLVCAVVALFVEMFRARDEHKARVEAEAAGHQVDVTPRPRP